MFFKLILSFFKDVINQAVI